eukprot:SAG11_NODE_782_length_7192_cov_4.178063_6_plen_55_part_00
MVVRLGAIYSSALYRNRFSDGVFLKTNTCDRRAVQRERACGRPPLVPPKQTYGE